MRARLVAGLAVLFAAAACQDSPPTGPGTAAITAERLELTGPSKLSPGETGQFRLTAINSGGSARDVTSAATWTSTKPSVATVAGGLVTAKTMGDVTIAANFEILARTVSLTILTPGTFRLTGLIREQGLVLPLANAIVQTTGAGSDVMEAVTTSDGRFTLYGVPAATQLRVTKPGYVTLSQSLALESNTSVELTLQPIRPRPDFSGSYRLTVTAANCQAGFTPLPSDLVQRIYTATVTQTVDKLDVALSGADLVSVRTPVPRFIGAAEILGATFTLGVPDFYYNRSQPDLVERVGNSTVLVISGSAATTLEGTTLNGTLRGSMVQSKGDAYGAAVSQCVSNNIPFVMTRQ